jgi:methylase of polypeptide subunit release factors
LTGISLRSQPTLKSSAQHEVFFCPEESNFYAYCLEKLVFNHASKSSSIIEFGSGDGSAVIHALLRTNFGGRVQGYELNPAAYTVAQAKTQEFDLEKQYIVHNQSFYDSAHGNAQYLIANPPYIPAPDHNIKMPLLYGGFDGAKITNSLLSLNYDNVMLLVSSYSNPASTMSHAIRNRYCVADFTITPLQFGDYSSEPKVKDHIAHLRHNQKAFYSGNIYFLAGVLFRKFHLCAVDLSQELLQVMTVL